VKNNREKYNEFIDALESGDTKKAHRLAHTIKGNAGFIGETALQAAAANIEDDLYDILDTGEGIVSKRKIAVFKQELDLVLAELEPLYLQTIESKPKVPKLSEEQCEKLFAKLEPMLQNKNPECLNLLDEIRGVEGSEDLEKYVEGFKFKPAVVALEELKKRREKS
jgi:chemotaxis protein histidine kinase CheA